MPRACPVESHVRCYTRQSQNEKRCHGLAPWSLTFAATQGKARMKRDATGLPRGVSRSLLHKGKARMKRDATGLPRGVSRSLLHKGKAKMKEMPRACPVESP